MARAKTRTGDAQSAMFTFTCFPKLPVELRLKILKNAMPGPRRVRLILKDRGNAERRFLSDATVPALLQVCTEFRQEGLKVYNQLLPSTDAQPPIYFNAKLDTLYFGPLDNQGSIEACKTLCDFEGSGRYELLHFKEVARAETLAEVQRLAISSCLLGPYFFQVVGSNIHDEIANFPKLQLIMEIYADSEAVMIASAADLEVLWRKIFDTMRQDYSGWQVPIFKANILHLP
jgi:hypothetical protein